LGFEEIFWMIELYARAQSSRTRLEEEMSSETTKAAAWAVFQHHGGSTNYNRSCGIGVRRATRFKVVAASPKIPSSSHLFSQEIAVRETVQWKKTLDVSLGRRPWTPICCSSRWKREKV
jgi:hypothetical protein